MRKLDNNLLSVKKLLLSGESGRVRIAYLFEALFTRNALNNGTRCVPYSASGYLRKNCVKQRVWLNYTNRRFRMSGTDISQVEIVGVSKHGFWLLLDEDELFVSFSEFPWFRKSSIE